MQSPTEFTLKFYRACGWTCQVVEHWVSRKWVNKEGKTINGFRKDLFGCIDIIAIRPQFKGVLGIQCCAPSSISARVAKCKSIPEIETWLLAGNRLEVVAFKKAKGKWERKVVELTAGECEPVFKHRRTKKSKPSVQKELFQ